MDKRQRTHQNGYQLHKGQVAYVSRVKLSDRDFESILFISPSLAKGLGEI